MRQRSDGIPLRRCGAIGYTRPMSRSTRSVLLVAGILATSVPAGAIDLSILTRGKVLRLARPNDPTKARGLIRFGTDPVLAGAPDPSCPATSSLELGLFTVRANAVERSSVALDCAKWFRTKSGWRYTDPATPGGIASIAYGASGLVIKLSGPGALPVPGPVGYAFTWFTVGGRRFHGRFHLFRKNGADAIASAPTSTRAAEAERRFWALLLGDAATEADETATLAALTKAAKRASDARSQFLLGMLRLYRFGRATEMITAPPAGAL